jgi:hypothetical protein
MFELILENKNGNQLQFGMGSPFTITEIEGLNPPESSINTSEIALMDGALYNSAKVNMRVINVAFAIEYQAAKNRIEVYRVLKSKHPIRLYYKSDYRNVFIDGYISSIDITMFEMKQVVACSILCPSPYFKDAQELINELSTVVSAFHFPFGSTEAPQIVFSYIDPVANVAVENYGDIETGLIIEIYAIAAISNPKIYNYMTGEFIGLNYTMEVGDLITIDTRSGEKTIKLLREGETTNIFNSLMKNSTWLQLESNGSVFTYDVGIGEPANLAITIKHYTLYEGV